MGSSRVTCTKAAGGWIVVLYLNTVESLWRWDFKGAGFFADQLKVEGFAPQLGHGPLGQRQIVCIGVYHLAAVDGYVEPFMRLQELGLQTMEGSAFLFPGLVLSLVLSPVEGLSKGLILNLGLDFTLGFLTPLLKAVIIVQGDGDSVRLAFSSYNHRAFSHFLRAW
jgi:hypothetical protein